MRNRVFLCWIKKKVFFTKSKVCLSTKRFFFVQFNKNRTWWQSVIMISTQYRKFQYEWLDLPLQCTKMNNLSHKNELNCQNWNVFSSSAFRFILISDFISEPNLIHFARSVILIHYFLVLIQWSNTVHSVLRNSLNQTLNDQSLFIDLDYIKY